ncbi:hypothetical protein Hanom_Chr07g00665441 [Helianthus anomalus]
MKFDLIYIVTISVMMLLSDLFISSRCFRHRLGCDIKGRDAATITGLHNLPWKLEQRNKNEVLKKRVYICPEKSYVHHDPSRAREGS